MYATFSTFTYKQLHMDMSVLKQQAFDAEREAIIKVMVQTNFNKSETAKILGIDRKTLYNKLAKIKELYGELK